MTLKMPILSSFHFFTVIVMNSIADQCHQVTVIEFLCSVSVGFPCVLNFALSHGWSLPLLVVFHRTPRREKNQDGGKAYKIGKGDLI